MAAKGAIKAGDAYVRIYADEAALTRSLKSVKAKLLSFSATVGAVGRSMMATGVIAAAPFALAGRTFAGFADQMATVKGELKRLRVSLTNSTIRQNFLGAPQATPPNKCRRE